MDIFSTLRKVFKLTGCPSIFLPSGLSLMIRVPHHDPEHGGSIFLTTLSLSMGRRVRVEDGTVSLSNRTMDQSRAWVFVVGIRETQRPKIAIRHA